LIALGADPTLRTATGTALLIAVDSRAYDCISYLLDEVEVCVNEVDEEQVNALYVACFKGDADLVRFLIKKGADPFKKR